MSIDAFCSQEQYVEHIAPIWRALPDDLRGTFQAAGTAGHRATQLGIQLGMLRRERGSEAPLTIVASYMDEQYVRPRPVVLVEHGAGQSYGHDPGVAHHPAYPGGKLRDAVCLFLCPNEATAQRWREMYPDTPTAVVGVPYLDPWHSDGHRTPRIEERQFSLVVFTFHWPCNVVPECDSAFPHYQEELKRLAKLSDEERGWRMAGHAHPRAHEVMAFWRRWEVPYLHRFADVLDQGDLLVADNTSVLFEFASTDRPVVVLNAPWYRKHVHHGQRFWEWATVGPQVDEPEELVDLIGLALDDLYQGDRRRVVEQVYAHRDGRATERAVAAIVAEYEAGHWRAWREKRSGHDPFAAHGSPVLDGVRVQIVRRLREQGRPLEAELAERLQHASEDDLRRILAALG